MTIEEMHITFRELGQQMGVQQTRAIFSENIDICINFAIDAKARSILRQNVGMSFSDKVARDNAKVSPINGLYTLYTQSVIEESDIVGNGTKFKPYTTIIDSNNVYLYTGFDCAYSDTDVVHCRLVERESLFDTLDDICNRPSKRYPVVTVNGNKANLVVDIGEKQHCVYGTPYGDFMIGITAKTIRSDLDENGGMLFFHYVLDVNSSYIGDFEIAIEVKAANVVA